MRKDEDMMKTTYQEKAKLFKAFCDENRIQILELLQSGEQCACVLLECLDIGQSTLSHHMKILTQGGVVNARNEGKWTYYSISKEGIRDAEHLLQSLTSSKEEVALQKGEK